MNKYQQELLNKCKVVKLLDEDVPLFDCIYILPMNKKHDSGYKIMYIVGYSNETEQYYLLDQYCDVVDYGEFETQVKDLHIDIAENGIIRMWSRYQQIKSVFRVSSCTFEMVPRKKL